MHIPITVIYQLFANVDNILLTRRVNISSNMTSLLLHPHHVPHNTDNATYAITALTCKCKLLIISANLDVV